MLHNTYIITALQTINTPELILSYILSLGYRN